MTRRTGPLAGRRTSAAIVAAVLLLNGEARAQSSGAPLPQQHLHRLAKQPRPVLPRGGSARHRPWSGEDGASGHPLMTASAIREAAANFDNCVASMWPDAARRNISLANFQRFTAGLRPICASWI